MPNFLHSIFYSIGMVVVSIGLFFTGSHPITKNAPNQQVTNISTSSVTITNTSTLKEQIKDPSNQTTSTTKKRIQIVLPSSATSSKKIIHIVITATNATTSSGLYAFSKNDTADFISNVPIATKDSSLGYIIIDSSTGDVMIPNPLSGIYGPISVQTDSNGDFSIPGPINSDANGIVTVVVYTKDNGPTGNITGTYKFGFSMASNMYD